MPAKKRKPRKTLADNGQSSRRIFLATLGAAAVAIVGCEAWQAGPIIDVLPEGGDETGVPPLPRQEIKPIVPNPVAGSDGIIPRSNWAHAGPDLTKMNPLGKIERITFHHSGDGKPFTATDAPAIAVHLEIIRQFHANPVRKNAKGELLSRGWGDIGYHYAIDPAGRVWALRSTQFEGTHVKIRNANNLGVVVLGDFNLQPMTAAAKQRVIQFADVLKRRYAVSSKDVFTHQEIAAPKYPTDCPGRFMQSYMVSLRANALV